MSDLDINMKGLIHICDNFKLNKTQSEFCYRCYVNGLEKYKQRLKNIDFMNFHNVLDAGSGYGQWSIALSLLNENVTGIEYDKLRVGVSKRIIETLGVNNVSFSEGSIEDIKFESNYFDAVFCYSVIFQTQWRQSICEFSRVLKKGGRIYINSNSYGWVFYNMIKNPNKNSEFSPRATAIKTLLNTLKSNLGFNYSGEIVINPNSIIEEAKRHNLKLISLNGDGLTCIQSTNCKVLPFFIDKYLGLKCVYEIVLEKE